MALPSKIQRKEALKNFNPQTIIPKSQKTPNRYFESIEAIADKLRSKTDEENDIRLNPEFQRKFVWGKDKQDGLINTIMEGGTIPIIFLGQVRPDKDGTTHPIVCVDGKQRLTTIRRFIMNLHEIEGIFVNGDNGFEPDTTKVVNKYIGKRFRDLDFSMQNKILNYSVEFVQERVDSPIELTEYFIRLNCGSAVMTSSEILFSKYEHSDLSKTIIAFMDTPEGKSLLGKERVWDQKQFMNCVKYFATSEDFMKGGGDGGADRFLFMHEKESKNSVAMGERMIRMTRAIQAFNVMFNDMEFLERKFTEKGGIKMIKQEVKKQKKLKMALISVLYGLNDHSIYRKNFQPIWDKLGVLINATEASESDLMQCLTVQTMTDSRRRRAINQIRSVFGLGEIS